MKKASYIFCCVLVYSGFYTALIVSAASSSVVNSITITSETGGNTVLGGEESRGTSNTHIQAKTIIDGVVVEDINQNYSSTSPVNFKETYNQNIGSGNETETVKTIIKVQAQTGQSSLVEDFNKKKAATSTATTSLARPVKTTQDGHVAASSSVLLAEGGLKARGLLQQFISYVFSIFRF
ncbi:MAG: hypothetical protein WC757_01025 [Candidatus Paceibacterota bacterium]